MNEAARPSVSATTRADLDWVQQAPALLADPELAWRPSLPARTLSDALPRAELVALEQLRQGRLGAYFEALAAATLNASGRYRLLARNRIISVERRTLGELDLVAMDEVSGHCLHIELALKFYLLLPASDQLDPACNWIGAGLRDFLCLKVDRLRHHQLRLPQLAQAQQAWPHDLPFPDHSEVWALGRGFIPFGSAPSALPLLSQQAPLGYWLTLSEFQRQSFHGHWINKANWLADHSRETDAQPRHPLPGQFFGRLDDGPAQHWFVVPDTWPAAARDRILQRFATTETPS